MPASTGNRRAQPDHGPRRARLARASLEQAALVTSVGLVTAAVGWLVATRTAAGLPAVVLLVLGGITAATGVVLRVVQTRRKRSDPPSRGLVARLRAMRAQRDAARRETRRLRADLEASGDAGGRGPSGP